MKRIVNGVTKKLFITLATVVVSLSVNVTIHAQELTKIEKKNMPEEQVIESIVNEKDLALNSSIGWQNWYYGSGWGFSGYVSWCVSGTTLYIDMSSADFSMPSVSYYYEVPWSNYLNQIQQVAFVDSKKSITVANWAFYNSTIEKFDFKRDQYIEFRDEAFAASTKLQEVSLDAPSIWLDISVFENCINLKTIDFLNCSHTYLGPKCFKNCKSLEKIDLSYVEEEIFYETFYNCSSLKTIFLSNNIKNIYKDAFYGCTSLNDVYFDGTKDEWNAIDIASGNEALTSAIIHFKNTENIIEGRYSFDSTTYALSGISYGNFKKKYGDLEVEKFKFNESRVNIPEKSYSIAFETDDWNIMDSSIGSKYVGNVLSMISNYNDTFSLSEFAHAITPRGAHEPTFEIKNSGGTIHYVSYERFGIINFDSDCDNKLDSFVYIDMDKSTNIKQDTLIWFYPPEKYINQKDYIVQLKNPSRDANGYVTWDCVWFGNYWQNDTNSDGKTNKEDKKQPIKWRVLSVNDEDIFLLSDKVLDWQQYNTIQRSVSWEESTLNSWLNAYTGTSDVWIGNGFDDAFSIEAFNDDEFKLIKSIEDEDWSEVFVLSSEQMANDKYGLGTQDNIYIDGKIIPERIAHPTDFVIEKARKEKIDKDEGCNYWVRQSNTEMYNTVNHDGCIYKSGDKVSAYSGVRPAIHIKANSSLYSYAGSVCSKDDLRKEDENKTHIISLPFKSHYVGDIDVDTNWGFEFFNESSRYYNKDLALTGLLLARNAYEYDRTKEVFESLGIDDAYAMSNDKSSFWARPLTHFGYEEIELNKTKYNLFVIAIRGTNGAVDVITDMSDGANSFTSSSLLVFDDFKEFIEFATDRDYETVKKENNKIYIVGHSLGGATGNRLSRVINEKEFTTPDNVYTYTFESPHTCWSWEDYGNYSYNFINEKDWVIKMPAHPYADTFGTELYFNTYELDDEVFHRIRPLSTIKDSVNDILKPDPLNHHHLDWNLVALWQDYPFSNIYKDKSDYETKMENAKKVMVVACPVDIELYSEGKLVCKTEDDLVNNFNEDTASTIVESGVKTILIYDDDVDYHLKITGTGNGTMNYSVVTVNDYDKQDYKIEKEYKDITVNPEKIVISELEINDAKDETNIRTYTVEDKYMYDISVDGTETKTDYVEKNHIVSFDTLGHGVKPESIKNVLTGSKILEPDSPTEQGYTFGGWYKEPTCSIIWDFNNDIVTTDITLYAKWIQNELEPEPIRKYIDKLIKKSNKEYILNLATKEKYLLSDLAKTKQDGKNYKVTYDKTNGKKSDNQYATIATTGLVTAKKAGKANITLNKSGIEYKITVNVYDPEFIYANPKQKYFTVNVGEKIVPTYDDCKLKPVFSLDNTSINKGLAEINPGTGEITALNRGSVTVSATVGEGKNARTVKSKVKIYDPTFKDVMIIKGEPNKIPIAKSTSLKILYGFGTTKWSVSDESIATVDEKGKLKATGLGKVIVTAINNGRIMTKEITVVTDPKVKYTVKFNVNGHGVAPKTLTNLAYGTVISEPVEPTATDYVFGGWYKEAKCVNVWDFNKDTVKSNITLYAKWTKNAPNGTKYTVTFIINGHGTAPATITGVESGSTIKEPVKPNASGYTFGGWYKESECINAWDFANDTVTSDIILYAKWIDNSQVTIKYTIKFDVNGGNGSYLDQEVEIGQKASKPTVNPTKEGYTFKYWSLSKADNTTEYDFNNSIIRNIILYAIYEKIPEIPVQKYTVTFNANGHGTAPADITDVKSGSKIKAPREPMTEGYSFDGWYKEAACINAWDFDEDIVTSDIILYGKWYVTYKVASGTGTDTFNWRLDSDGCLYLMGNGNPQMSYVLGILPLVPDWYKEYRTKIKKAIISSSGMTRMSGWFYNCENLYEVEFKNCDTKDVLQTDYMFANCSSLEHLDLRNMNTSNVTDIEYMFSGCSSLETIDLSSFDTSNVTVMFNLFKDCSSLKEIDVSGFKTSKVKYVGSTFEGCNSLESIDISAWDTSEFISLSCMFRFCESLKNIKFGEINTSKVNAMNCMFEGCRSLESLDLSKFDTSNVEHIQCMFSGCSKLKNLDVSNFNTSKVGTMNDMFEGCSSLESIDISNFDTSNATTFSSLFENCSSLKEVNLGNLNASKVTYTFCMFKGCSSLESLDLSNIVLPVDYDMLAGCSSLKLIKSPKNVSNLNVIDFPENTKWYTKSESNPRCISVPNEIYYRSDY